MQQKRIVCFFILIVVVFSGPSFDAYIEGLELGLQLQFGDYDQPCIPSVTNTNANSNYYGCLATFGMDYGCPLHRYSEIYFYIGTQVDAKSDAAELKVSYLDEKNVTLGSYVLKDFNCDWHQFGKMDTFKLCAAWIPMVKKVRISVSQNDGIAFNSVIITFGNFIARKNNFWLDNPLQPIEGYSGWEAHTELTFDNFQKISK